MATVVFTFERTGLETDTRNHGEACTSVNCWKTALQFCATVFSVQSYLFISLGLATQILIGYGLMTSYIIGVTNDVT